METWDSEVDILVRDPSGTAVMAVEVKGRPLTDRATRGPEWKRLLEFRAALGTPYGLLFSPGKAFLVGPEDGILTFEGQKILDAYDIREVPRFQPGPIIEAALYNWLVDLTMGIDEAVPNGFPILAGDRVLRTA